MTVFNITFCVCTQRSVNQFQALTSRYKRDCITLFIFITAQVVCLCQVNNTAANPVVLGGNVHLCTT